MNRIDFNPGSELNSLTFVFSNQVRSPPSGSYKNAEPTYKYALEADKTFSALVFGLNEFQYLNAIDLFDQDGEELHQIRGTGEISETSKVDLKWNEHIVSAAVELNEDRACNV